MTSSVNSLLAIDISDDILAARGDIAEKRLRYLYLLFARCPPKLALQPGEQEELLSKVSYLETLVCRLDGNKYVSERVEIGCLAVLEQVWLKFERDME